MLACFIKHLRMETNMKFHVHKAQQLNPRICNYFAVPNTLDLQYDLHLQQVFSCEVFTIFSQIQHIKLSGFGVVSFKSKYYLAVHF